MPHFRASGLMRHVRDILAPEFLALVPAFVLAGAWFGPHGAAIVAAGGLPLAFLVRRNAALRAEALEEIALDATTGLPQRDAAIRALDRAYLQEEVMGKTSACIVVELDDDQKPFESFGHAAQKAVLSKIGERLRGVLRDTDIVCRLEGTRFAIALAPARRLDLEALIQISGRLKAAVSEPMSIDATGIYVSVSVGFCLSGRAPERTGATLLAAAELALEEALRNGPAAIRAFSNDIAEAAEKREALRDRIEAALENGEIVAYFQPQLSTDTGDVVGFEALARWQHPQRGVLPPVEFLPVILAAGLGERLGEVMLAQALSALRAWDMAALGVPGVSVNFSKEELRNPDLTAKLQWELDRFDLAPERLTVEILESVIAESDHDVIVRNVTALSDLGCGIDLDDFGTGHASLAAIRRFAIDRIKIDRSYITHIDSDQSQQRMVVAVLAMAENLGLKTLAEGIESIGEHALLAQLGCTHVQGFAIARPMPVAATAEWLRAHRAKLSLTPGVNRRIG
ncbi:putative signaling protein [Defluviimonas aquaemixtae]|uniref:Putative signaling protein n=1 Tax=Albidovulum aquaemixtae TaxID=1542388 RepID=A0A2R8B1M1_9RHOB|nr:bifunctional diguanylate cyclase/phosphodiesterase [Defluviimonas aquaemixtae]SPH16541.1 putative signaling protein [Defluviimonas aquaemixtae]